MEIDPLHTVAASVGFASMALLWLAVLAGLSLARGWVMTRVKHSTLLAVHGGLAVMGLTLGVVHGFAQLAPADTTIRLIDVVVPFTHPLDPFGIGAGVIALEVMIALALSLAFKRWMGFHRWRALHSLAYASYTLMTGHILISGAETGGSLVTALVLAPWLLAIGLWLGGSSRPGMPRLADKLTTRLRGSLTTVQVDPVHCARFGFCEQEAPEVFTLRGDGQLAYHTVVADQHVEAAIRAVRACPARAIALTQGAPSRRVFAQQRNGRG
jgi:ferredoxin/DMSO/TMAO reductase YedYZ heme-binding membrane subunit